MTSPALVRSTDPPTSREAAAVVSADITNLEGYVVRALIERGPSTDKEIADWLGRERVTVSPRMAPLRRKGVIEKTGEIRDGCAVHRLTERQLELRLI